MIEYFKAYFCIKLKMSKRNFNLLKPLKPPSTSWDKIYDWLIGKARVVILCVELIVAVTFMFKVIVDTTAKNKDTEIEKLNEELAFYSIDLEPKFRKLQDKSDAYIRVWNGSNSYTGVIQELISYVDNEDSQVSINVKDSVLVISGYENLDSLKSLESSIKNSPNFNNVTVSNLTLSEREIIEGKGRYSLTASIINSNREAI